MNGYQVTSVNSGSVVRWRTCTSLGSTISICIHDMSKCRIGGFHYDAILRLHFAQPAEECVAMSGEPILPVVHDRAVPSMFAAGTRRVLGAEPSRSMTEGWRRGISIRPIGSPGRGGTTRGEPCSCFRQLCHEKKHRHSLLRRQRSVEQSIGSLPRSGHCCVVCLATGTRQRSDK